MNKYIFDISRIRKLFEDFCLFKGKRVSINCSDANKLTWMIRKEDHTTEEELSSFLTQFCKLWGLKIKDEKVEYIDKTKCIITELENINSVL